MPKSPTKAELLEQAAEKDALLAKAMEALATVQAKVEALEAKASAPTAPTTPALSDKPFERGPVNCKWPLGAGKGFCTYRPKSVADAYAHCEATHRRR